MITPDISLIRNTLAVLGSLAPREGRPTVQAWVDMNADLNEREAEALPAAVAEVIPLLRSDKDRLRISLEITTVFDLYEALPSLLQLLGTERDPEVALSAAYLANNPGVPPQTEQWLSSLSSRLELTDSQATALAIRLDPSIVPRTPGELRLHAQVWTGSNLISGDSFPIVALDELGGSALTRWRIAADLVHSGAILRRIPASWAKPPRREWLGPQIPIVAFTSEAIARLRAIDQRVTVAQLVMVPERLDDSARKQLLRQINERLPGHMALRLRATPAPPSTLRPFAPEVYRLGAFDSKEMAFLGSGSRGILYKVKEELSPRKVESDYYWSFNQLVALRTWQYFRAVTTRGRVSLEVLKALEEFAGSPTPTRVGVTAAGNVLLEEDGRFVDHKTGQEVLKGYVLLDKVFQPFTIGAGHVPRLLDPSQHTRVNPAVLGGTPTIKSSRIPARAIAQVAEASGSARLGILYPELSEAEIRDAINVGNLLMEL